VRPINTRRRKKINGEIRKKYKNTKERYTENYNKAMNEGTEE